MRTLIPILLALLLAAGCAGGKSMTFDQEARVSGIISDSRFAGTIDLTGNSESIIVNCKDLRIESGQPMIIIPRISTSGLSIEVHVINTREGTFAAENF